MENERKTSGNPLGKPRKERMKVLSGNGHKKCGLQRRGSDWISELSCNKWIGQFFQQ